MLPGLDLRCIHLRSAGRKDDVLVLGTGKCTNPSYVRIDSNRRSLGEKVVPIPQEGIITASPLVSGAVMFGRGRNQCGLLVEPRPEHNVDPTDPDSLVAFRKKIWCVYALSFGAVSYLYKRRPVVEEANKIAPTFARIFKEMIIATDPARPLPRAGKGTVIRPQSLSLYSDDIDRLYVENSPRGWKVD